MQPNIPATDKKRIVIIGGGFAGLTCARKLQGSNYQVVLLDRNNYHQFQPLFYQVATSKLEASSVSFPFRKVFQRNKDILVRIAEAQEIDSKNQVLKTDIGEISYDYLVIAVGTTNNFFGNKNIEERGIPMKSVSEALLLRNTILTNFEKSLIVDNADQREGLLNLVVVGGGPTGTEISGTLAEMRKYILPKDYPELDFKAMKIYLLEGMSGLLNGMSPVSQQKALEYLQRLGVEVRLNTLLKDYDGIHVLLGDGSTIRTDNLIWAAGVTGNLIKGLDPAVVLKGNRIKCDAYHRVEGYENIYAVGDISLHPDEHNPKGLPQLASVGIQQGGLLGRNFVSMQKNKPLKEFNYFNKGTMATVGRNKAVVDLPFNLHYQGFLAWVTWMFVHLILTLGIKNKASILLNWLVSYVTYDQSLRLIIKPKQMANKSEFATQELN